MCDFLVSILADEGLDDTLAREFDLGILPMHARKAVLTYYTLQNHW